MRRTGKTTQQILDSPKGAVFICLNHAHLQCVKKLCAELGRDDLMLKTMIWLDIRAYQGCTFTGITLDHACWDSHLCTSERYHHLMMVRTRVRS